MAIENRIQISWRRLLLDGALLNGALGTLLISSLAINAEMWVQDYPPDIKEAFGPKSENAERQAKLLAIPFFSILLGMVIWSTLKLRRENGGVLSFQDAFLHIYVLWASFWLFDLTILDWLFFVRLQPSFIVLPGTEGMEGYEDYGFHLKVALPALPLMVLPALVMAFFLHSKPQLSSGT